MMMITITWLLIKCFTIVILDMGSALHVEYFDVVLCGAFVDIKSYPMDGLATIRNSMRLLRDLNYKQTLQMSTIWNGFHLILLIRNILQGYRYMAYLFIVSQNRFLLG